MKNKPIKQSLVVLTLATGLGAGTLGAREVKIDDCPTAVQATIRQNSGEGKIDEIDFLSLEGKEIYIAEVELPGDKDLKVYVSGDGNLLKTREDVALKEVPEAVRTAISGLEGSVDDIDRETAGKTVTYEVELDRHGKPDLEVTLSADGRVLSQKEEVED
ncbi:hypothetical protein ACFQY0_09245 [Haloferula chungangensis]|uniref:Beta-lactamase-inhibitor-like PepSY-like domain-containing protein n=1 Tax=Haloferula chungangensis TaxID=1048331 RepID=A0ABW2L6T7_9BACT